MHRFYLPPEQCQGKALLLTGGEAHHALHVLRVRRGEQVTVLDGVGRKLLCEVQSTGAGELSLTVLESVIQLARPWQLTLIQALPKGKIIETIIQKATELGVDRIVPLLSERVVTILDRTGAREKQAKWQAVALEAIKQCGSPWLPKVEVASRLSDLLGQSTTTELALVGSLPNPSRHPRFYFQQFEREHGHLPKSVAVFVGPEGDFTSAELQAIQAAGAQPITLGPLVLRSETAATYCLSIINYEMQWLVGNTVPPAHSD